MVSLSPANGEIADVAGEVRALLATALERAAAR
jgi:hypothetical protein